jgi:hypothetical protein
MKNKLFRNTLIAGILLGSYYYQKSYFAHAEADNPPIEFKDEAAWRELFRIQKSVEDALERKDKLPRPRFPNRYRIEDYMDLYNDTGEPEQC